MRCNFFFLFFFPLCAWGGVSEGVRGREGGERGKVFVCARVCLGVFRIRKSQKKSEEGKKKTTQPTGAKIRRRRKKKKQEPQAF